MPAKPLTHRDKSVRRHNVATILAFVSLTAFMLFAGGVIETNGGFRLFALLSLALSLIVMFATRNADEYVSSIWRAGTSVAFVVTVSFMLFAPALEGFVDGFTEAIWERETAQDILIGEWLPPIALASFFTANACVRLRGSV